MIGPQTPRQSRTEERDAYDVVTLRDKGTCQRCRRPGRLVERDHRQNRDGRNTVPSNLQLLCGPLSPGGGCHLWKTEHPREAVAEGWAVPRHTLLTPAEWPARRWLSTETGTLSLRWVLYDDVGGWEPISDVEAARIMEGVAA